MKKIYICIDLKSFYASVECVLRNLDPLTTNLVVADITRTDKTICLAVSPSLKKYGIGGRARLFEVKQKIKEINKNRKIKLDFIIATPQMKKYMEYSTNIYKIYLKYFSKEDILVYSIDECFIDITNYLNLYKMTPKELVTKIIQDIVKTTGITATGGIGTNMYLAKIAMDIVAKHKDADEYGVRIAELDEISYRKLLWDHLPITDFWRVGKGTERRLNKYNMKTMGDIALMSIKNENLLFKIFGVNAELLIDHAWGWEPCNLEDAKKYKPRSKSISSSQVLHSPYNYDKAKLIVSEMSELLSLELVKNKYLTNEIVLNIGYDACNINNIKIMELYDGEIDIDYVGRKVPKQAHGSIKLSHNTCSTSYLNKKIIELYNNIVNPLLLIRRISISFINLVDYDIGINSRIIEELDLFNINNNEDIKEELEYEKKEIKIQKTILELKNKYGKNSILKAMNLFDGARTIERNKEIGGHKA